MRLIPRIISCAMLLAPLATLAGCGMFASKKPPLPVEMPMESPYADVHTYAIAPAINLSGSRDFDPLVVSDILFGEMEQVRGLNVLPVNKTLMAMQKLGVHNIEDVRTAQHIAEVMQVDALVVPAVTAYDPYNPPTVGMILQLYTPRLSPAGGTVAVVQGNNPGGAAPEAAGDEPEPVAQVNAMFQGTNQSVLRELHAYAEGRTEYGSALAEERFVMDVDSYMRFVCHAMVRRLMDVERTRSSDR